MEFPNNFQFKINPNLKPKQFTFYVGDDAVDPLFYKELAQEVNFLIAVGIDCSCVFSSKFVEITVDPNYVKEIFFIYNKYFNSHNHY